MGRRRSLPLTSGVATCALLAAATTTGLLAGTAAPAAAVTTAAFATGQRPGATRLGFSVGDRVAANVDVGTGNLSLSTTDLTLPGIGSDVSLGVDFNSLLLRSGSPLPVGTPGPGWAMRLGADTKLVANADGSAAVPGAGRPGVAVPVDRLGHLRHP